MDMRMNGQIVLNFGIESDSAYKKYASPFIHPGGNIVAMGEPKDTANPKLLLWDLRYVKLGEGTTQTIFAHEKRILRGVFHRNGNSIMTISTDNTLGFIDYLIA